MHSTDNDRTTTPPAPRGGHPPDLAQLRQLTRYQRTTAVLERRADRSANAPLAAVLRERAAARRRLSDRVRARLAAPARTGLTRPPVPPALYSPGTARRE